jgi:Cys-tRNA(Pro) deacylase
MSDSTPVSLHLDSQKISYRLFTHASVITSLEQAAQERGQHPDQVIRSIVFRVKDEYVMVLMAGARQVSWATLRKYFNQSRLTMAKEEELLQVTGYEVGAVSPFALARPMRILADESIFIHDETSIGSGVRGTTIIMKRDDLKKALGKVELGKFSE